MYSSHVQNGWTALICAANRGHIDTVKYLVKETTANVNATSIVSHCKITGIGKQHMYSKVYFMYQH